MKIIVHRVNSVEALKKIPTKYGVEIDVRESGGKLILNHEPFAQGVRLETYLKHYSHALMIVNIKEAGIESKIIELLKKYKIKNYFFLDVETPYLYSASRAGFRNIAVRYSEIEPIETLEYYRKRVDWVWIDTITKLPLNKLVIRRLKGFRTCLVCPERWGREKDIVSYKEKMKKLGFTPDAVMTSFDTIPSWEK